jgi:hypothetical protein
MRITADRLNAITPHYQPWTPAWSNTGGTSTGDFGNAAITARYSQTGSQVDALVDITFGSTTVFETDNWRLSLPLPALVPSPRIPIGFASLFATDAAKATAGLVTVDGPDDMLIWVSSASVNATALGGPVDATHPFTWASGSRITATIRYETTA